METAYRCSRLLSTEGISPSSAVALFLSLERETANRLTSIADAWCSCHQRKGLFLPVASRRRGRKVRVLTGLHLPNVSYLLPGAQGFKRGTSDGSTAVRLWRPATRRLRSLLAGLSRSSSVPDSRRLTSSFRMPAKGPISDGESCFELPTPDDRGSPPLIVVGARSSVLPYGSVSYQVHETHRLLAAVLTAPKPLWGVSLPG
jgi:hypothetical protein